jgi:probable F420-dependent oxidoreductase
MLGDIATLLRRIWAGETVSYDGPLGRFPALQAVSTIDGPPPGLALAAIGPRTLALAGELYDSVILHPLLTTEATARSCEIVRASAARAGRDPSDVHVIATVIAAPELDPDVVWAVVGGRAVTYLQTPGFGELLVEANSWDPAVLERMRAHPMLRSLRGGLADWSFTLPELATVARELPGEWLSQGAAIGDAATCAGRVREYLEGGADEVVLHGNAPAAFAPLVRAFTTAAPGH